MGDTKGTHRLFIPLYFEIPLNFFELKQQLMKSCQTLYIEFDLEKTEIYCHSNIMLSLILRMKI